MADDLRAAGWLVHRIADYFPDDAQCVADEEWLAYGLARGWVPLCKDGRIKGRHHEHVRSAIGHAVEKGGPAVYAIGESGIRRTWP